MFLLFSIGYLLHVAGDATECPPEAAAAVQACVSQISVETEIPTEEAAFNTYCQ